MLILSLDCAGTGCAVCLWRDGSPIAATEELLDRGQDRRLMPLIVGLLASAGITFADLDRIAVTRGPGSFTGLRIGLAAALGMGLAAEKPVFGIDRFEIYSRDLDEKEQNLLVVIGSRRKELYCKFFPSSLPALPPCMMTEEDIGRFVEQNQECVVMGDVPLPSLKSFRHRKKTETCLAAEICSNAPMGDENYLPRPLYIRPPDVTFRKSVAK